MGITVYLAGAYARRKEFREYAEELKKIGFIISSSWIYSDIPSDGDATPEQRADAARKNLMGLLFSSLVICFGEPHGSQHVSGGRHVEFGYALALRDMIQSRGKRASISGVRPSVQEIMLVGGVENVFHFLPDVRFYATVEKAISEAAVFFRDEVLRLNSLMEVTPVPVQKSPE